MWRIVRHKLSMDGVLQDFGKAITSKCHCCTTPDVDTMQHLVSSGCSAQFVWDTFQIACGLDSLEESIYESLNLLLSVSPTS